jgi:inosine/xanthosine triphosphate pyrophosphatase family protein
VGLDRIVLATLNEGKAKELARLLGGTVRAVETLREHAGVTLPPETGRDYRANALAKARAVWNSLGVPAVGDDSGLEVDALNGAPGLHSARYAGEKATDAENNTKLLQALAGVAQPSARRDSAARSRSFAATTMCSKPKAFARAPSSMHREATTDSATIRSSCPRARLSPSPSFPHPERIRSAIARAPRPSWRARFASETDTRRSFDDPLPLCLCFAARRVAHDRRAPVHGAGRGADQTDEDRRGRGLHLHQWQHRDDDDQRR